MFDFLLGDHLPVRLSVQFFDIRMTLRLFLKAIDYLEDLPFMFVFF
jgi:hypothetical protein